MTNKDITIENLKKRKKELKEDMLYNIETESKREELFEINDTLKKLGVDENDNNITN